MKKAYLIASTALLIIFAAVIFNACKKEEAIKNNIEAKEWQEKIEYMDIPCVDFSRIKKEIDNAKGMPMLHFESWEHYASVIDAMLKFSYNYIATRVQQIRDANQGIDDDDLSLIIHNEGIYQFMPLYSFCQQLQFEKSAFKTLRTEEIKWMNNAQESETINPFDEMGLGYIQSALHNENGDVMIGNEIFNPADYIDAKCCPIYKHREEWWDYNYNGKKRRMVCKITSTETYTYGKTSMWYYHTYTSDYRVVWCCNISVALSGLRWKVCDEYFSSVSITGSKSVFASVVEKYCWYSKPNYLSPDNAHIVFTTHTAPGKTRTQGL